MWSPCYERGTARIRTHLHDPKRRIRATIAVTSVDRWVLLCPCIDPTVVNPSDYGCPVGNRVDEKKELRTNVVATGRRFKNARKS